MYKYNYVDEIKNIVKLLEKAQKGNYDVEAKLSCSRKYWQAELFALLHNLNSITFILPLKWFAYVFEFVICIQLDFW